MVRSFRLRPVGWQRESYRHYLASKGISTNRRSKYFAGKGNFLPSHYHSAFASGLNRDEYEKKLRDEGREDLIQTERKETPEFVRAIKEAPVEFTKARPSEQLEEESLPVVGGARVAEEEEEERPGRRKYGVFSDNLSPGVPPSGFFSGERLE